MIETTSHFLVSLCPYLPPPSPRCSSTNDTAKTISFRSFFHKTIDPAVRTHRSSCKTIRYYLSEKITREKVSIKFNVNIVIRNDRKSEKNVAKPSATPTTFTNCTDSAVYRIHNWKLENCIMLWQCADRGWCVWPVCDGNPTRDALSEMICCRMPTRASWSHYSCVCSISVTVHVLRRHSDNHLNMHEARCMPYAVYRYIVNLNVDGKLWIGATQKWLLSLSGGAKIVIF